VTHPLDIAVVIGWIGLTFAAGLWFGRRASHSTNDYLVTDRSLPWWVIGTSMVATTFAADTPLAVAGYVAAGGIAFNWRWWFTGLSAMATVFLFAKLWRRTQVITEAELCELRYGTGAGSWLRGLKALWFGCFLNLLVIAWVMQAMRKVVEVVLDLPPDAMLGPMPTSVAVVLVLFLLAVAYTGAAGMYGVVATDVMQFGLAMFGSIVLAVLSWNKVGGLLGMQQRFDEHGFDWQATTALIPAWDAAPDGGTAELLVLVCITWWAARNVDGGSYLAQRLFAAKDERHALWGYLWYTFANLCLRPWPWIVVGLAGMAWFGPIDDAERYYPMMMVDALPPGLFGLMVAAFLAAFMSTIDTQLHFGASMWVNDVYRRFLRPNAPDAHHLLVSRLTVFGLAAIGAVASFGVTDIRLAWELALAVTAGLGSVYVARWYWWRVSAWSELAAMGTAAIGTLLIKMAKANHPGLIDGGWSWLAGVPAGWLSFPFDAALITLASVPIWLTVTFLTPPPPPAALEAFYDRVRPGGPGWRAVAGHRPDFASHGPGWQTAVGILGGFAALFGLMLGMGAVLLGQTTQAGVWLGLALVGGAAMAWQVHHEVRREG
jgi:Na+/proline symporter